MALTNNVKTRRDPDVQGAEAAGDGMLPLEPMDPRIDSIQPGGGFVMRLELAWGRVRRWWLRTFRRSFVERMQRTRRGVDSQYPHDILDPRDLKYFRNREGYWWDAADDPFAWRDRLPFARAGLAELLLCSLLCFGGAALIGAWLASSPRGTALTMCGGVLAAALLIVGALIVWFFRDPRRRVPTAAGTVVSPADGVVVTIERIEYDEFVGGPAILVGIFLSIFNVHINRAPFAARVIGLTYRPGKFLNALRPESARENEQLEVRLQSRERPAYRFRVRQISGAIARRIVCWLKPGDDLAVGAKFGMIKLGSRTELVLPETPEFDLRVRVGDRVKAGTSVIGVFGSGPADATHGA